MTASLEKRLLARIEKLERLNAEIMARLGMDQEALDKYDFQDAIAHARKTGDHSLIQEHWRKVHARDRSGTECNHGNEQPHA